MTQMIGNLVERLRVPCATADSKEAADEIERLRAALRFYADPQGYTPNQGGEPPSPVLQDFGQRARDALEHN